MTGRNRAGVTLIELLIVVGIIGILSGLAAPAVLGVRQSSILNAAMTDLRAIDVAVTSSCGKGRCGVFTVTTGSAISRIVPDDLKEFLPIDFEFKKDSNTYAVQLETWQFDAPNTQLYPLCRSSCMAQIQDATWVENTGFTNTIGFRSPKTIYVNISILTRNADVAQSLFTRSGGSAPYFISSKNVWKYTYPVLVGVPATG